MDSLDHEESYSLALCLSLCRFRFGAVSDSAGSRPICLMVIILMVLPYVLRLFFLSRHQDEVTSDPKVS